MAHMITKHDNIHLAKVGGWHKLGTVKDIVTKEDLLTEYGYEIVKEQLLTYLGEETSTYATVRTLSDGKRIILGDKLSAQYHVLQNRDLINAIDPLLDAGMTIETGGTLDEGRRMWVLLAFSEQLLIGKNDRINRYMLVSNEHTGKEAARIGFVPERVVCWNTMQMAINAASSQLIRLWHQGNIAQALKMAVDMVDTANAQFLAYGEQLDRLAATEAVNQRDLDLYVKRVFLPDWDAKEKAAQAANASVKAKEAFENMETRYGKLLNQFSEIYQATSEIIDHEDTRNTWYGAYQSVNHLLNHVHGGSQERRMTSLVWGTHAETDRRALAVATAMAK